MILTDNPEILKALANDIEYYRARTKELPDLQVSPTLRKTLENGLIAGELYAVGGGTKPNSVGRLLGCEVFENPGLGTNEIVLLLVK